MCPTLNPILFWTYISMVNRGHTCNDSWCEVTGHWVPHKVVLQDEVLDDVIAHYLGYIDYCIAAHIGECSCVRIQTSLIYSYFAWHAVLQQKWNPAYLKQDVLSCQLMVQDGQQDCVVCRREHTCCFINWHQALNTSFKHNARQRLTGSPWVINTWFTKLHIKNISIIQTYEHQFISTNKLLLSGNSCGNKVYYASVTNLCSSWKASRSLIQHHSSPSTFSSA